MTDQVFRLFVPKQAVGANLVYFDLFNSGTSGHVVEVSSVIPVVSGAVAVTGVVSVDLFLTATTAVGTGGTAATVNGTDTTAATISCTNLKGTIPSSVTARLTPTGGATAGQVLAWTTVFTEETNAGTYARDPDLVALAPDSPNVILNPGAGIRVVQGAVASVGNIGFNVSFGLRHA